MGGMLSPEDSGRIMAEYEIDCPTLYEEFFEAGREDFEAGREDFETTLRRVVIAVAQALIREGDHASAEDVLLRAYRSMSDGEELGELLQRVLLLQGKRVLAARISLRVAEAA